MGKYSERNRREIFLISKLGFGYLNRLSEEACELDNNATIVFGLFYFEELLLTFSFAALLIMRDDYPT